MSTKITRYATTEYNRAERVKNRLRAVFSQAVAFRLTHAQILEKLQPIRASHDYQKLTSYYRGYMRAAEDAGFADIWHNHVAWCLGPASGPTRQAHTAWTEEMSTLCRTPGALYGGHYWTDDNGQPTDRPFTAYACTNAAPRFRRYP
jgi:hypothetical protein